MKDALRKLSGLMLVSMFAFVGAYTQQVNGTLSGVIKDETGGIVPGVEVTAVNTGTAALRSVVSDDEGRYRIVQLTPGSYELHAELAGFQTAVLQNIELSMAQEAVVGITLKVGEISEQVVVSAEISLVDTRSATVAALVDNQQIRDLPLNGRDFIQLASLQEGVLIPTAQRRAVNGDQGVKISIGGARTYDNAILLDGTDIKNQYGTTPGSVAGVLLGVDTIREFRVLTNTYSAEYGRFTGGVISSVTKSGTNELHGTAFEFLRNSALDARNFFDRDPLNPTQRSSVPDFKRNQFGFTLGGPIAKDRTFFFGSYEGLRERLNTTSISTFPNAAAHNGVLPNQRIRGRFLCGPPFGIRGRPSQPTCNVEVDPRVQPYIDLYPLPNGPDNGDGTGQFFFGNPTPTDEDYFVVKVDHKLTDNDDVFVRYTFDDGDTSTINESSIFKQLDSNRNQYTTIEWKHVLSPSLLNEFRFAYNRSHVRTTETGTTDIDESLFFVDPERQRATGFPAGLGLLFCRGCGLNQFGTSTRTPQTHTLNTFQVIDNLVWNRGNHALKMGVSWSRFQYNAANFARLQGTYQFNDLPSLLRGQFREASVFFGDLQGNPQPLGLRQNLFGLYLQDDIQLRHHLTVNLGLRYEFITEPVEVEGRLGNLQDPKQATPDVGNPLFDNPSLQNFSPRVGFAWDPTGSGKTSVRGGFGLFHQQILTWCCTSAIFRSTPFAIRGSLIEGRNEAELANFPNSLRNLDETFAGAQGPSVFVVSDPNQPYLMQWSLTLQRELVANITATATYSGSRGVKLPRVGDENRPDATPLAEGGFFFPNPRAARANPNFADITNRRWDGKSYHNSLRLGLRKRFDAGYMFQASYQWARSIDDGSGVAGSPRESFNDAFLSSNILDHNADRGLSSFHIEHAFTTNMAVELPFGKGRRFASNTGGVMGKLIEGWQINTIVTLATGAPQNIEGNPAQTCTFCSNIQASIKPGAKVPKSGDPNGFFIADITTISEEDFPFVQPEPGFFGNLSRNAGDGPGVATVDLSILKNFSVSEDAQVQFRAEFFNLFNRVNFQGPVRTRSAFTRGGTINRSFGRLTETSTTSRQIQFAVKLLF